MNARRLGTLNIELLRGGNVARMNISGSPTAVMEINDFFGLNTAVQFSQIDIRQSPDMENVIPGKVKGLRHRPGTKLITDTAQPNLARMFPYRASGTNNIVATSGTTLYKFDSVNLEWDAQTMTNALNTANIDAAQFRDDNGAEVLVIADGGNLKSYNGTAVANITPATDETAPLPANALATINSTSPAIGVTVHNNRLVIWPSQKDIIYHSKPGFFDYFPETSYQRFVVDNDYIQTCISFGASLLVFMRQNIGVLFGDGYSATPQSIDWSQDFLDTTDGCVNGRSVQVVVFPDGSEQVFYQTDRGVSAVMNIDTKSMDNSTRFATRSVTETKIDWNALGVTNAEWASAVGYYTEGKYWLTWFSDGSYRGLVYDTNNDQWYPVKFGVSITDFYANDDFFYFIGTEGHLKAFDDTIHKDYTDFDQTTGVNVAWYWYSKLMNPTLTGFDHLWDILIVESQQFEESSTIDVEVNTLFGAYSQTQAIKSQIFIVGVSVIGEAQIANTLLTDIVNNANRQRIFLKGQYAQIKLSSDRGEPVELYNIRFEVRVQQTYQ